MLCVLLVLLHVFITVISSVLAKTQVVTLKMNFDLRVLGDRDGANGSQIITNIETVLYEHQLNSLSSEG
jgi:hypothetical protein